MKSYQLLLASLLVVITADPASAQRGIEGILAADTPVTLLPDPARTPLAMLRAGTVVEVVGREQDGWYRISFQDIYLLGDRIGYVQADHVKVGETPGLTEGVGGAVTPAPPSRRGLSPSSIDAAIILGRQLNRAHGLHLRESERGWLTTGNDDAGEISPEIRLSIHTPLAWIQELASDATAADLPFTAADVTDEATAPVLRITAYTGVPVVLAPGMVLANSVQRVVLRGPRNGAIAPVSTQSFAEHVMSPAGGRLVREGLRVTFSMDAIRELRGPRGDGVILVSIMNAAGEEKTIRLTRDDFAYLPM